MLPFLFAAAAATIYKIREHSNRTSISRHCKQHTQHTKKDRDVQREKDDDADDEEKDTFNSNFMFFRSLLVACYSLMFPLCTTATNS